MFPGRSLVEMQNVSTKHTQFFVDILEIMYSDIFKKGPKHIRGDISTTTWQRNSKLDRNILPRKEMNELP